MGAGLVDAGNEETHSVWSFTVVLGICLGAVADGSDEAFDGDGAVVGHAGGERLVFHEVGEDAGVGGETGERESNVFIDGDYFFLVRGEFFSISLVEEVC